MRVSAETACEIMHKALPRKRHGRGCRGDSHPGPDALASASSPGGILPAQPRPLAYWVNRISAATVMAPDVFRRVSGPGLTGRAGDEVEETVSSEIVQQRAEVEGVIAGRTLCDELRHVAETSGDAYAYSEEAVNGADAGAGDRWRSLTWSQVRQRVLEVAAGFAALGLAPGERVAFGIAPPTATRACLHWLPQPMPGSAFARRRKPRFAHEYTSRR